MLYRQLRFYTVGSLVALLIAASFGIADSPQRKSTSQSKTESDREPTDTVRPAHASRVLCGIDVLQQDGFRLLQGKRVGLITNQTGVNGEGISTARLLHDAPNVHLVALFSPEHGLEGKLDIPRIGDTQDPTTGVKVYSLYSKTRRPSAEALSNLDTLVFDIQDVGTRFYTYISTMGYAMEAAARQGISMVVLDRPNPINGRLVEGPVLDAGRESFVGYYSIPVRHGMTVGELARLFRHERNLALPLTVVPIRGWRRADYFEKTGLLWVNPSPNMRSLNEAVLYPGIGLLETTNLSVGRGTDTPFEVIGAPWLDGIRLARHLSAAGLPGVGFVPIRFTPVSSKYADELCGGIALVITDRKVFRSVATGLEIAVQLRRLYPDQWEVKGYDRLLGNQVTLEALTQGKRLDEIQVLYQTELEQFKKRRARWLMYE